MANKLKPGRTDKRAVTAGTALIVGSHMLLVAVLLLTIHDLPSNGGFCVAFSPISRHLYSSLYRERLRSPSASLSSSLLRAQQVTQQEAQKGIDKVVAALRKDAKANAELGKLEKVTIVLGYGSPSKGTLALRFNAAFKKGGSGLSSVPLPFGLGQSNVKEGRGTMVGQVKAAINMETGKVTSCSVFRDLGYGRSFDLKL
jgi:hypothetical protein